MSLQDKTKLTLRLNRGLIELAKRYAARHNISVSSLVEAYFRELERLEEDEHTPLVNRLTGILPADVNWEKAYGDYLVEKYGQ